MVSPMTRRWSAGTGNQRPGQGLILDSGEAGGQVTRRRRAGGVAGVMRSGQGPYAPGARAAGSAPPTVDCAPAVAAAPAAVVAADGRTAAVRDYAAPSEGDYVPLGRMPMSTADLHADLRRRLARDAPAVVHADAAGRADGLFDLRRCRCDQYRGRHDRQR